jgi:hypothetical protein
MMLRKLAALAAAVVLVAGLSAHAQDKKPEGKKVTLEGKLVCTKCELKETKACGNCLVVADKKDKAKEVKYYLADKGAKAPYHGAICQAPADAKVSGTLSEKKVMEDGKEVTHKVIENPKVEIKK